MRRLLVLAAALAALAAVAVPVVAAGDGTPDDRSATAVAYAVIGDTPYGQPQIDNFPNDVAEIDADPKVRLVLHLGDIKNGSTRCDTSYFQQILADLGAFKDPLVYTPGDNEWTDCHRANNGGYTPTERLATIRQMFFADPGRSLGDRSKTLDYQAAPYVENVRWSASRVEFGTIDVPGSNNDWLPWFGAATQSAEQVAEYTGRNAADLAWLDHVFASAEEHGSAAVVLGIQADMWDPAFSDANANPSQFDHFTDFVQELANQTLAFGKPVLLLNGDSHKFVDDYPLSASAPAYQRTMYGLTQPVPNLHRITVNGSTTPCHEWLKLTIDPRSEAIFSVERVLFHNQPGFDPAVCPST
jgi:Calcineurin-like phosphoesterase